MLNNSTAPVCFLAPFSYIALIVTLMAYAVPAPAYLIYSIDGLLIDGTAYDVSFHNDVSFNDLWDADNDREFEPDGSIFNYAPTFWGDEYGAVAAAQSIMAFLGTEDKPIFNLSDSFYIPVAYRGDLVENVIDTNYRPLYDYVGRGFKYPNDINGPLFPYASFVEAEAVPAPSTAWLVVAGFFGLFRVVSSRRKRPLGEALIVI